MGHQLSAVGRELSLLTCWFLLNPANTGRPELLLLHLAKRCKKRGYRVHNETKGREMMLSAPTHRKIQEHTWKTAATPSRDRE